MVTIFGAPATVTIPRKEHARLVAVEAAVRALLAEKGHVTRAEVTAALAATGEPHP